MTRTACTLLIVGIMANWAGAQVAPPPAAVRVRQLHTNAGLLEELLGHGVAMSDAPDSIDRAGECRKAVATLGGALSAAAGDPDAGRVAELADRTAELLETGLAPVLGRSREQVRNGSPGAERLAIVEREVTRAVADCRTAIGPTTRSGTDAQVRAARSRLEQAVMSASAKE